MKQISFGGGRLTLDGSGRLSSLQASNGTELLPARLPPQPFVQIGAAGKMLAPTAVTAGEELEFSFAGGASLCLSVEEKAGYGVFTVTSLSGEADALVVGPVFTSLCGAIGDIIGVAQGGEWAVGLQALNAKTLGGFPVEFKDSVSPYVGEGPVSELSVAMLSYFESAGFSANVEGEPASLVQLYCENRRRPRVKDIMNFAGISVPPMADGPDAGIAGASFALFCCPREEALDRIGEIELGENLPHPMLGGEWAKKSRAAMESYLISEFTPESFSKMLGYAKEAGFHSLYHPEPFSAWGHFTLREDFCPEGDKTLKAYCDAAAKEGMRIGLHTLSAFTTTNDPYVTPLPDPRLAVLGESALEEGISADSDTLSVGDGRLFRQVTSLQTLRVGDELIRYEEEKDGFLTGCRRGAWGTQAAPHKAGEPVKLLCDHPYKVFFPNLEMQEEYSRRLGSLFAQTGAAQISFDGLEGCAATGEDGYGINRFCLDCWDGWGRPDVINDASRLNHNLWHMHTWMNWGEPWGAKMREGMIEYRIKNQDFYRRNLFPRMLGWFLIRKADRKFEATPPEDLEWALSMAAGFDAGYALSTSEAVLDMNGCTKELLGLIRDWDALRLSGILPEGLRQRLRDPKTEWHLEKEGDSFRLYPVFISQPFVCDLLELQPGQPGGADWVLTNPFAAQDCDLRLKVEGNGQIHAPSFITKGGILRFPCTVKGGQYLWYRNGKAYVTDRNYNPLEEIQPVGKCTVKEGQQAFSFSCGFSGEEGPEVTVKVFTRGEAEIVNGELTVPAFSAFDENR